jgi:hypothetical protein
MRISSQIFIAILSAVSLSGARSLAAQSQTTAILPSVDLSKSPVSTSPSTGPLASIRPVRTESERDKGVDWNHLFKQSFLFLSIENAFRCATEEGTREGISGPFFAGYLNSVGNLHGWNDGDPFLVNYVGHPMQGAVTGYLWTHNDRAYREIQFGQNRRYWKGKLRGAAYSYIYSVLFEIGPISEASIGNIQAEYPQQGFVDHVVTPVIGLGWSITEDVLDQYVIRRIEDHTGNKWIILLVRGGLNPARSMANVMAFEVPWHRDNRPGVSSELLRDSEFMDSLSLRNTSPTEVAPPVGVAPFEFNLTARVTTYFGKDGGGPCPGGGGTGALRMSSEFQFVVDVSGCKLLGLENNFSGDSLSYLAGTRWTPKLASKWAPHLQILIGGNKLTHELVDPTLEKIVMAASKPTDDPNALYAKFAKHWETNGLTVRVGGGVDVRLNSALSYRIANLEYSHAWNNQLNGISYRDGIQFTTGLVLQMGTW